MTTGFFLFFSLKSLRDFLVTAYLFIAVEMFLIYFFDGVHLCCPYHIPERQIDRGTYIKAATEENSQTEKDR